MSKQVISRAAPCTSQNVNVCSNKTRTVRINVILRCGRVTIIAVKKAIIITHSEGVLVALVFQHAIRIQLYNNVICPISDVKHLSTLSCKRRDFREKLSTRCKMSVTLSPQILSETF